MATTARPVGKAQDASLSLDAYPPRRRNPRQQLAPGLIERQAKTMFPTTYRARQHRQRESPPEPGSDSTYGVRSLNASVEWSADPSPASSTVLSTPEAATQGDSGAEEGGRTPESPMSSPPYGSAGGPPERREEANTPRIAGGMECPATDLPALEASPDLLPPSPNDTLHPLSSSSETERDSLDSDRHPYHRLYRDSLRREMLEPEDPTSEPSSPASFTSLPSYVASISSVSRTSSPLSADALDYRHRQYPNGGAADAGETDDLVLPTLSLPSTSLHLSLKRWEGEVGGVRVAVLGDQVGKGELIRALGEREELVELGRGEIGVVREGKVRGVFMTGLGGAQVHKRVLDSYTALHGLLHPRPAADAQLQLVELAETFAAKSDWVHLVYALPGVETGSLKLLAPIVPTLAVEPVSGIGLFNLPTGNVDSHLTRIPSPVRVVDATPMPHPTSQSYFQMQLGGHGGPEDCGPLLAPTSVDLLHATLDSTAVQHASTASFFAWRQAQQLEASFSSTSPTSSSFESSEPMPTVARVQGGGEWEASLSRRMAKRRDDHPPRPAKLRGKTRRRTLSREENACHSLFPKGSPKISGTGLWDLVGNALGRGKRVIGRGGWKWGVVACAVALAVGWGCWRRA